MLVQGGRGRPRRGSIGKAIVLALVFGALGLVGGSHDGERVVGLGFYAANPRESARPGSCTLMAPVFSALGGLIGLPGGAIAGIVIGLARRWTPGSVRHPPNTALSTANSAPPARKPTSVPLMRTY